MFLNESDISSVITSLISLQQLFVSFGDNLIFSNTITDHRQHGELVEA